MTTVLNAQERSRFMRFAVVGTIGAVVDFGTMNLLTILLQMAFIPASVVSFGAAVCSNFLWNRFWTYPDSRSKAVGQQVGQFLIISVIGLLIRTPILHWLETNLMPLLAEVLPSGFPVSARFMAHNLALAVAVLVVMMWNFFANRYWTYNDVS
jgi:putative flippase GtrA